MPIATNSECLSLLGDGISMDIHTLIAMCLRCLVPGTKVLCANCVKNVIGYVFNIQWGQEILKQVNVTTTSWYR